MLILRCHSFGKCLFSSHAYFQAKAYYRENTVFKKFMVIILILNFSTYRKSDRLAVTKLVSKLTRGSLKSPYAVCMLIRIACKLIEEEDPTETTPYFEFVESCIRHKSEMVIYEAANAIVNLKRTTSRELIPAISVLQLFCSSPKATMRFAAVRTLNQVIFSSLPI